MIGRSVGRPALLVPQPRACQEEEVETRASRLTPRPEDTLWIQPPRTCAARHFRTQRPTTTAADRHRVPIIVKDRMSRSGRCAASAELYACDGYPAAAVFLFRERRLGRFSKRVLDTLPVRAAQISETDLPVFAACDECA